MADHVNIRLEGYTADPHETRARAQRALDAMGTVPDLSMWRGSERDGHEADDWKALRGELQKVVEGKAGSEPGSVMRLVQVYGDDVWSLVRQWISGRQRARERAAKEAERLNSAKVQKWSARSKKWGKPKRVPLSDLESWGGKKKPQDIILDQDAAVRLARESDPTFGGFNVRSFTIKSELPQGTVKDKWLVRYNDGRLVTLYLVRPRGRAAEKRYQAAQALRDAEAQMINTQDYMTPEEMSALRDRIKELKKQAGK